MSETISMKAGSYFKCVKNFSVFLDICMSKFIKSNLILPNSLSNEMPQDTENFVKWKRARNGKLQLLFCCSQTEDPRKYKTLKNIKLYALQSY